MQSVCDQNLSLPDAYAEGVKAGIWIQASRERAVFVLSTYEVQPDSHLTSLYPNPQVVRNAPLS